MQSMQCRKRMRKQQLATQHVKPKFLLEGNSHRQLQRWDRQWCSGNEYVIINIEECSNSSMNVLNYRIATNKRSVTVRNDNHYQLWSRSQYLSWLMVSISSTFYEQLLRQYPCAKNFLCLHFGFVIIRRKIIGAKAARKMLMKLTHGHEHRDADP